MPYNVLLQILNLKSIISVFHSNMTLHLHGITTVTWSYKGCENLPCSSTHLTSASPSVLFKWCLRLNVIRATVVSTTFKIITSLYIRVLSICQKNSVASLNPLDRHNNEFRSLSDVRMFSTERPVKCLEIEGKNFISGGLYFPVQKKNYLRMI